MPTAPSKPWPILCVATLFPENRTHYLNILHASWPAGMVLGSVAGWVLDDKMQVGWKTQLALYLIPTVLYAIMFMGQKFPKSEAAEKGASFVSMLKPVGILGALVACYLLANFFGDIVKAFSPDNAKVIGYAIGGILLIAVAVITKFSLGSILLFVLFVVHALVGAVELGTDGWIQNITGNLFTSEEGKYLFIWTSAIMFGLRFCAHWIENTLKLSPVGLLVVCAIIASVGLVLASGMQTSPWPSSPLASMPSARPSSGPPCSPSWGISFPAIWRCRHVHYGRHWHAVRRDHRRPWPWLLQRPLRR